MTQDANNVVRALNARTGHNVTEADYRMWFDGEGDGNADAFDAAVIELLGEEARDVGEQYARLDNLVRYALDLGEPRMCGGIDLGAIVEGLSGFAIATRK